MEGADAGAPSAEGTEASPPVQENSGPTTTSDMPIAPVYGGAFAPYNFGVVKRSRKQAFMESQAMHRHADYGTDYPSPFVPAMAGPKGGIDMNRHLSGTGETHEDPLDFFKAQPNKMDRQPEGLRRPNRSPDTGRQRKRGTSAYLKVNKENMDSGGKTDGTY